MPARSRPCPRCGREAALIVAKLVYPADRDWDDKMALVCWPCNIVRRRGEEWQAIHLKRHEKQWKAERKKWKSERF